MNEQLERVGTRAKPAATAPHAIERLAGRREAREGIAKTISARKITQSDLSGLRVELGAREEALLSALFKRVVLPDDAVFDGVATRKDVWNVLNAKFREAYGQNAVVLRTFRGKAATGNSFYWLALNPELFDAVERKPRAGKHYNLKDVFSLAQAKILSCLARQGYSTVEMVAKTAGLKVKQVKHELCYSLRQQCKSSGFPNAVEKRGRNPTLYRVSARFAKHFGLTLESRVCLEVFSEAQRELIERLRKNPNATLKQIAEYFGFHISTVAKTLERVSERAALFGLKAFEKYRVRMEAHYSLSQEFEKAVGKKGETKRVEGDETEEVRGEETVGVQGEEKKKEREKRLSLSMHFTSRQAELIERLAGNPHLTRIQLAKKMKIERRNAEQKMRMIEQACAERGLPVPFDKIGRWNSRYSVRKEFAKLFGLKVAEARAGLLLTKAQRKVYSFFKKRRSATTSDASAKLGIRVTMVDVHIRNANAVLKANGFEEIKCRRRYSTRDKTEELVEVFVEFRRKNGRWPKRIELEHQKDWRVERIVGEKGGIRQAREIVWGKLNADERRALMAPEWAVLSSNGLFDKFNGGREAMKRAALDALEKGVDACVIEGIIAGSSTFGKMLRALETA